MATYVLLDANNVVRGAAKWDGVTEYNPPGIATIHLLPTPPPAFRIGDTYNPVTDVVTPRADTADEIQAASIRTVLTQAQNAIDNLQQVRTRAQALQSKANYAPANLAAATVALNDLLDTVKQMGLGVDEVAQDLIGIARLIVRRFNGT